MADKLVTIFQKGLVNTRAKDFYDIWALSILENKDLNYQQVATAAHKTAVAKKVDHFDLNIGEKLLEDLKTQPGLTTSWKSYQLDNDFARSIHLDQVLENAKGQLKLVFNNAAST